MIGIMKPWDPNLWNIWSLWKWNPWSFWVSWLNIFSSKEFSEEEICFIYEICDDATITKEQKKEFLSFVREMNVIFEEGFYPEMYI